MQLVMAEDRTAKKLAAARPGQRRPGAGWSAALLAVASLCLLAPAALAGQAAVPTHPTAAPVHKPAHRKRHKEKPSPATPAPVAVVQAPPRPDWPVNDPSQPAHVKWDGSQLTVTASNASLSQVLHEVSSATGLKVEGLDGSRDQRIFGSFGPAPARDVLNQVLDGSGYNVILLGDTGAGAPRELLLAAQTGGAKSPANAARGNVGGQPAEEEPAEEPEPEQPEPQRPQQGPPPPGVRPAQQYLQDLRNQQQQQQQANPGQTPPQAPPNE